MGFLEKSIFKCTDFDYPSNHRRTTGKNLEATLLFVSMELRFLTYGLPKETVTAIMMLYRNTTAKVRSADGDTDLFDIVVGVLLAD